MNVCFLFPGQGSQYYGMAHDLVTKHQYAQNLFNIAEKHTGLILHEYTTVHQGSYTANSLAGQIALYTMSCSIYDILDNTIDTKHTAVAGHSFGSFAALYSARCYDFVTGLDIIVHRHKYITELNLSNTGMLVCLFHKHSLYAENMEICQQLCKQTMQYFESNNEHVICEIANYNANNQFVLSGHMQALEYIIQQTALDASYGIIKTIKLHTELAYHSSLLTKAGEQLESYLNTIALNSTNIYQTMPIIWNNTGRLDNNHLTLSKFFASQLSEPVFWEDSMKYAIEELHIDNFYELGPSKILCNILKHRHCNRSIHTTQIDCP